MENVLKGKVEGKFFFFSLCKLSRLGCIYFEFLHQIVGSGSLARRCFFLPNSINGKGYFSNHHQCRSAVAQCTKLRFDKNIVRYSTVSEMSFYSLQLDKTILNDSNFICQNLNNHNGQNLVKTQLCAVVSCEATVFVL